MPGPLVPVFDAHCDALQRATDLGHDLGRRTRGHFDLPRARAGGLAATVLVCWCEPPWIARGGARARTQALLAAGHKLLANHPRDAAWFGDSIGLAAARAAGRLAITFGIEGGHSIENSLLCLEQFFHQGVRVMTLVWNNHLDWIRSCQKGAGPSVPSGLSSFGRSVVRRMNELGMLVDLSHAGERSFYDALCASSAPVIASHSGCSHLHAHPRNLSDDQLRALAAQGGVMGIVFCPPFLDEEAARAEARLRRSAEYRALQAESPSARFLLQAEWLMANAPPLPASVVLDHLCHAVSVAGLQSVGIGTDFDGIERTPAGLEDASTLPYLAAALLARGFSGPEIEQLLFHNLARVFEQATRPARGRALDAVGRA